jgi:hypothetical protein
MHTTICSLVVCADKYSPSHILKQKLHLFTYLFIYLWLI